jgi:hypothetical protein
VAGGRLLPPYPTDLRDAASPRALGYTGYGLTYQFLFELRTQHSSLSATVAANCGAVSLVARSERLP